MERRSRPAPLQLIYVWGSPHLTDSSAWPISLQQTRERQAEICLSPGRLGGGCAHEHVCIIRSAAQRAGWIRASLVLSPRCAQHLFQQSRMERDSTSLTHSNKAKIHSDLNHDNNPTSLELEPAIERKGIHYAFETRTLILSGKRDSLTLSWLMCILWWGVLIASHCRGLNLTYCTVYALWMFKWVSESLLNVFLSSVSNVFDEKALRIRVRNVVISRRDSTGIKGRNNWECDQEKIIDFWHRKGF